MSRALTVELSEEAYAALQKRASSAGVAPERVAAADLERQYASPDAPAARPKRRGDVSKLFGAVASGAPIAFDNDALDAALARAYADNHEAD